MAKADEKLGLGLAAFAAMVSFGGDAASEAAPQRTSFGAAAKRRASAMVSNLAGLSLGGGSSTADEKEEEPPDAEAGKEVAPVQGSFASKAKRRASALVIGGLRTAGAALGASSDERKSGPSSAGADYAGPVPEALATPWQIDDTATDLDAWALSEDGLTIYHERKHHDVAVLDLVMREGVHKLSFRFVKSYNNKGHSLFVGVLDADASHSPPKSEKTPQRVTVQNGSHGDAWSYHPYDGMIYHSKNAYERGQEGWQHNLLPSMKGTIHDSVLHITINMDERKVRPPAAESRRECVAPRGNRRRQARSGCKAAS